MIERKNMLKVPKTKFFKWKIKDNAFEAAVEINWKILSVSLSLPKSSSFLALMSYGIIINYPSVIIPINTKSFLHENVFYIEWFFNWAAKRIYLLS